MNERKVWCWAEWIGGVQCSVRGVDYGAGTVRHLAFVVGETGSSRDDSADRNAGGDG